MGAPRDSYLTFSGAGEQEIQYTGRHIRVRAAPSGPVFLSLDGVPGEFERAAGEQLNVQDRPFQRIRVRSAVAQTVHLVLADTPQDDNRVAVALSVAATIEPGAVLDDGGDVVCAAASTTLLLAGNPDRLYALVKNPSANSITVRVGTSGVGAANGTPLEPGETLPLATTAAVYAHNPDPANPVTISASAVDKV